VNDDDSYEDDEPVEKILAAFDRGEKGRTAPPVTAKGIVIRRSRLTASRIRLSERPGVALS
jgi:hypothetical protein